ncbi:MAG: hypothetical protein LBE12_07140 [Planctomycetaceae bacterium]|nr:hypothetical protein [Planctomycetaceae bacterium]
MLLNNYFLLETDILAEGMFIKSLRSTNCFWIGSSNQHVRFLTNCYLDWKNRLSEIPNRIEVRISLNCVTINYSLILCLPI